MQLMHQYCPWAAGLLALLVPIFEPMGLTDPTPGTILGFDYTPAAITAIAGSAVRCSVLSSAHSFCCCCSILSIPHSRRDERSAKGRASLC